MDTDAEKANSGTEDVEESGHGDNDKIDSDDDLDIEINLDSLSTLMANDKLLEEMDEFGYSGLDQLIEDKDNEEDNDLADDALGAEDGENEGWDEDLVEVLGVFGDVAIPSLGVVHPATSALLGLDPIGTGPVDMSGAGSFMNLLNSDGFSDWSGFGSKWDDPLASSLDVVMAGNCSSIPPGTTSLHDLDLGSSTMYPGLASTFDVDQFGMFRTSNLNQDHNQLIPNTFFSGMMGSPSYPSTAATSSSVVLPNCQVLSTILQAPPAVSTLPTLPSVSPEPPSVSLYSSLLRRFQHQQDGVR
ncbi:hypothetical protein EV363DRAFT_1452407 [Boletus edulis]|nr:hypothetical protein EV363DRAFT_1452407 [Boletus edulis]